MTQTAVIGIAIMLTLIFLGMNIGLSMALVGFVGYWYVINFRAALGVLQTAPATQAGAYALTVIPLFIMMGNFAFASGMSKGLYSTANKWLNRLPGGLACATMVACAGFGAICGSTAATTATMGTVAIPEMRKYGYNDALSTGAVSIGGSLGIIIPPSAPMIVYGIMAEQSIGRLFAAGIVPGILLTVLLCTTVVIQVKLKPSLAPAGERFTWRERFVVLKDLFWMFVLFAGVFYSMFSGIFTINEAAAGGAFLAMIITFLTGNLNFKTFMAVMKDTVKTSAMTYLLLIGAVIFGNFLAITRLPMTMANTVATMQVSRYLIFACIVLIYAILGCLMDALPMIMLTVPIFLPVVLELGFNPIWFGVMLIFVMQLGLITPPVGLNCYVISGIAKDVPLQTIFRGSAPFIVPVLLAIAICTAFPTLTTWLPTIFYG